MLPLCFGQATKAAARCSGASKAYRARLVLGAATDTGDADGSVVRTGPVRAPDAARLGVVLAALSGERTRCPHVLSPEARWRPLYELARRVRSRAEPRRITIDQLEPLSWTDAVLRVRGALLQGHYVRVLR